MNNAPQKPAILPEPLEWIFIPSGQVTTRYGTLTSTVADFYIAKYPITNAQYAVYVRETGQTPKTKFWTDVRFNQDLQPVIEITWIEAIAFCQWLSQKIACHVTLPTEEQWQRAAQGDDNRKYPWGNEWDSSRCNNEESQIYCTTPVTKYPLGASPYGVMDMLGNVWEWCLTDWETGENVEYFELGAIEKDIRLFKGGSCCTSTYSCHLLSSGATPITASYMTGIRLVSKGSEKEH